MSYHVHRPDREITNPSELYQIVKNNRIATLALCRNNEPYVVTLTYGFEEKDKTLYFHCGRVGLKLAFIKHNPNVCLTIIETTGMGSQTCDHPYTSIVIRGKVELAEECEEKDQAIRIMIEQLEKKEIEKAYSKLNPTNRFYNNLTILKVKIEEITGKQKVVNG